MVSYQVQVQLLAFQVDANCCLLCLHPLGPARCPEKDETKRAPSGSCDRGAGHRPIEELGAGLVDLASAWQDDPWAPRTDVAAT